MLQNAMIEESVFEQFSESLAGQLIRPNDPEYDETRALWNGMIDKKPAFIIRCHGVADVIGAVSFARENRLPVSVRAGGHSIAGLASSLSERNQNLGFMHTFGAKIGHFLPF
jgi:FAD/FMN-containing dehydrogenase